MFLIKTQGRLWLHFCVESCCSWHKPLLALVLSFFIRCFQRPFPLGSAQLQPPLLQFCSFSLGWCQLPGTQRSWCILCRSVVWLLLSFDSKCARAAKLSIFTCPSSDLCVLVPHHPSVAQSCSHCLIASLTSFPPKREQIGF